MNFTQFFCTIRARKNLLLNTVILTVAIVLFISLIIPGSYKATATLVLNYKGVDPLNGVVIPAQLMPGYMATQVGVIESKNVAGKVVDELKLADDAKAKREFEDVAEREADIRSWLAGKLLKNISVDAPRDSSVVSIIATASDPQFSAKLANAFADKYQETIAELRSDPLKKLSGYLNEQTEKLRVELQAAHDRRARFQQENGLVNIDARLDVENARLNDLSNHLATAQARLAEASSRSRQTQQGRQDDSPDIASNPLIQNLKAELARAEANLAKIATAYTEQHPSYQAARVEVDKARSALLENIRSTNASVRAGGRIAAQQEAELRESLEAQRKKVLALNSVRARLALLDQEVDSAQKAYDASSRRFHQVSSDANTNQADIGVLNPATPPVKASGPRILRNVLLAIGIGIIFGIGLCLLAEIFDRRVRAIDDLEMLRVPVIGRIDLTSMATVQDRGGYRLRLQQAG